MILISNFKYPRQSNNKNHLTACSNQRNYKTAIMNWTFFLYSVWFLNIILRYFAFVFYRIIPILTLICSSLVTSHWMNVATPGPVAFNSLSRARPAASGVIQNTPCNQFLSQIHAQKWTETKSNINRGITY